MITAFISVVIGVILIISLRAATKSQTQCDRWNGYNYYL